MELMCNEMIALDLSMRCRMENETAGHKEKNVGIPQAHRF
jgi:hypothetical protein